MEPRTGCYPVLNIGITDSGPMGAGNAAWRDPVKAAQLSAQWVKGQTSIPGFGSASSGIRAIANAAGQSPQTQLQAIRSSGWASSGYPSLASLYNTYRGTNPAVPAGGAPTAAPAAAAGAQPGPVTTFDQAAYDAAQKAAVAGQFFAKSGQSVSMWNLGPKTSALPAGPSLFGSGLFTTTMPNRADYTHTTAQTSLQQLAGDTNLTTHPGSIPAGSGDINPLAHGWTLGRTDQGVDASAPSGTAILAINDSVVKDVVPNWYNGQPLVLMQLTAGPNRGKYYYLAEQVHNGSGSAYSGGKDWKVGQTFARGQVIGRYAPMGTGIEIGWGSPTSAGRTLAQEQGQTGDVSHGNAPAGIAFRKQILGG